MRHFKFAIGLIISFILLSFSVSAQQATTVQSFRLQTYLTGLSSPVFTTNAKDGSRRMFVVQQGGIIKVIQPGSATATDFMNITTKVLSGGERGLLGLTFHPQFTTNGYFFVDYTRQTDGATIIARYKTTDATNALGDPTSEKILLTIPQPFSNHNGGTVEFGPDGYLYIGMGDGGSANDPGGRAQNPAQLLGKLLRIDVNVPQGSTLPYLIPPTNPFAAGANTVRCETGSTTTGNTCQELWTLGMRNPYRWSFDRGGNHELWAADVGQGAIEEVDVIANGGGNYGWRVYEGTQCTNNDPSLCVPTNYIMPIFQYTHAGGRCSITGGYVYRGARGSLPNGAYVYADYCTGEILMWQNNQQTLLLDTPRSIISFGEDEDGEIYVCYSNGQIDRITRARANADFDGDLKTDFSVFRNTTGIWYTLNSSNNQIRGQAFGAPGDIPAPEDYDGDNITDFAVFRPSNGTWYYLRSGNNTVGGVTFGANGDVPQQADYDGDGKADFAVFRASTGVWYRLNSSNNAQITTPFGASGDVPAASDYDGDGKADITVFRGSTGTWYRINSSNSTMTGVQFGGISRGDYPVPGDYDGDGKTDIAVIQSAGSLFWYVLRSSNNAVQTTNFGASTDVPASGDYDGDGRDDIAVFRKAAGLGSFYVIRSSDSTFSGAQFGISDDLAAPAYDLP